MPKIAYFCNVHAYNLKKFMYKIKWHKLISKASGLHTAFDTQRKPFDDNISVLSPYTPKILIQVFLEIIYALKKML